MARKPLTGQLDLFDAADPPTDDTASQLDPSATNGECESPTPAATPHVVEAAERYEARHADRVIETLQTCHDVRKETFIRQTASTLTRGQQLRMLARIELPYRMDTPRGPVSGAALVAVLRAIDDHAHSPQRDQPLTIEAARDMRGETQPGIAERIRGSSKLVSRANCGLERLRLLDIEQYRDNDGRVRNRYLIDWSRVQEWITQQRRGDVNVDDWIESVTENHSAEATGRYVGSPPDTMTPDPGHDDCSPPDMVTAPTTLLAHSSLPPPPPSIQRDVYATDTDAERWEAVGEELRSSDVGAWRETLTALRQQSGMTPERAIALCRYFVDHRERLGIRPGMLVHRLNNDHPDRKVDMHWGRSTGVRQFTPLDELASAERRLREMPADELAAFAEDVLTGGPLQIFEEARSEKRDPLKLDVVASQLARKLAKQEESR